MSRFDGSHKRSPHPVENWRDRYPRVSELLLFNSVLGTLYKCIKQLGCHDSSQKRQVSKRYLVPRTRNGEKPREGSGRDQAIGGRLLEGGESELGRIAKVGLGLLRKHFPKRVSPRDRYLSISGHAIETCLDALGR